MNLITSFFLRAKHWQIFILVFGVYLLGQMALVSSILASPTQQEVFAKGGFLSGLVMTLSTLGFFVWFWSMGSFLNLIVKPELKLKSGFFRVALIYPSCYFVFFIATFQSSNPGLLGVILPLHLFAMICMFYLLNFVSKNLVLAETSKPVSFYDYVGPFFLLWFFPLVSGLRSQGLIDFTNPWQRSSDKPGDQIREDSRQNELSPSLKTLHSEDSRGLL